MKKQKVNTEKIENLFINEVKLNEIMNQNNTYNWTVSKSLERIKNGQKLGLNTKNFLVLIGVLEGK